MKLIRFVCALLAAVLLPLFCESGTATKAYGQVERQVAERSVFAMDTYMTLTAYGKNAEAALDEAIRLIQQNEAQWSVTRMQSEISRINRGELVAPAKATNALISRALELSRYTMGAYDPTVYPLVSAWGFTTGEHRIPSDAEIAELLTLCGTEKILIGEDGVKAQNGAMLDLGGIAKGYTGDMLCELLREKGVKHALLNLGGNVQTLGTKPDGSPWRIGIRSPLDDSLIGAVAVKDQCVITSGAYERCFTGEDGKVYGHIISPFTGKPVDNGTLSVSVVCTEGAMGDALSTALFVMGPEQALSFWRENEGFELILLDDAGTLYVTEGLGASFTNRSNSAVKRVCKVKR